MSKEQAYKLRAEHSVTVRIDAASMKRLNELSRKWQVTKSEVIRRLLRSAPDQMPQ